MGKTTNPRQMSSFTNNKAVVELMNKLQPATPGERSCLHRKGEKDANGRKLQDSLIGINVVDYSAEPSVFVQENITPSQLKELYEEVKVRHNEYFFSGNGEKIFGEPDKDGYSLVRTIMIWRQGSYKQKDGTIVKKNYPWTIKIQNGKGIKERNEKTGGSSCKKGSFKLEKVASINLSDGDFFSLLDEAICYLNAWENYYSSYFVKEHEKKIKEFEAQFKKQ